MDSGKTTKTIKNNYELMYTRSRANLLLLFVFSVLNIVMLLVGSDTMLLFSATVPYYIAFIGLLVGVNSITALFVGIAIFIMLLYFLCWIFSKKHPGWMIAALVMFVFDTVVMVRMYISAGEIAGVLDILMHIWILYYLISGVISGFKRRRKTGSDSPASESDDSDKTPVEDAAEAGADCETAGNSGYLYKAENDVKFRILAECTYMGYDVCYRRVKRVNELVINGYVYDNVEMLVEPAHSLSAVVGGHTFTAGCDGINSYIIVDGERLVKKIRLW